MCSILFPLTKDDSERKWTRFVSNNNFHVHLVTNKLQINCVLFQCLYVVIREEIVKKSLFLFSLCKKYFHSFIKLQLNH